MNRSNIEKIAHTLEDRLLLAKVWDKIQSAMRQNVPGATCFLSPRELEMTRYLFGDIEGLYRFGGYEEAERRMLVYLPEYLSENYLEDNDSPLACLSASFYKADTLNHRDILGALMGCGIARESIGDILVGVGNCDFFCNIRDRTLSSSEFHFCWTNKTPFRTNSGSQGIRTAATSTGN